MIAAVPMQHGNFLPIIRKVFLLCATGWTVTVSLKRKIRIAEEDTVLKEEM